MWGKCLLGALRWCSDTWVAEQCCRWSMTALPTWGFVKRLQIDPFPTSSGCCCSQLSATVLARGTHSEESTPGNPWALKFRCAPGTCRRMPCRLSLPQACPEPKLAGFQHPCAWVGGRGGPSYAKSQALADLWAFDLQTRTWSKQHIPGSCNRSCAWGPLSHRGLAVWLAGQCWSEQHSA